MWLVGLLLTLSVAASDDKALSIESEMMEAMGGRANWEQARFVRFTLVRGNRTPIFSWDRWTGQLRIESRNAQGIPFVILMNVKTRQGQAYLDGRALEGKELSEHVNLGYRMWAGGTYWFLMPFKWRDEGVVLAYDGEETIDGEVYDRIHLSFDKRRPVTRRPVLGLDQSKDAPDGPVEVQARGRSGARLSLDGLASIRRPPCRDGAHRRRGGDPLRGHLLRRLHASRDLHLAQARRVPLNAPFERTPCLGLGDYGRFVYSHVVSRRKC